MSKEILLFLAVGFFNTLFGYSVYALLIFIGCSYFLSLALSTVLGVLFNFQTIGKIVFKSSNPKLIGKFFGVYLVVFLVNLGLIKMMKLAGLNDYYAGAIALVPAAALSFVLNKYFVFNR